MAERRLAWCGILAPIVFTAAFILFARMTPGYSHLTNMVSELGTFGAANAPVWNLAGFIFVGLLVTAFAWGLHLGLRPGPGAVVVPLLVAITGLGFAGLGLFPAEAGFEPSPRTTAHFVMVTLSYLPFVLVAFIFALRLRADPYWKRWSLFSIAMGAVGLASFLIPRTIPAGLSQRIGLSAYFVWVFGLGFALLKRPARSKPQTATSQMRAADSG